MRIPWPPLHEIVSQTLRRRAHKLYDNSTSSNALLAAIRRRERDQ
jgi:hypothetical protein